MPSNYPNAGDEIANKSIGDHFNAADFNAIVDAINATQDNLLYNSNPQFAGVTLDGPITNNEGAGVVDPSVSWEFRPTNYGVIDNPLGTGAPPIRAWTLGCSTAVTSGQASGRENRTMYFGYNYLGSANVKVSDDLAFGIGMEQYFDFGGNRWLEQHLGIITHPNGDQQRAMSIIQIVPKNVITSVTQTRIAMNAYQWNIASQDGVTNYFQIGAAGMYLHQNPVLDNNLYLYGLDTGSNFRKMIGCDSSDVVMVGSTAFPTTILGDTSTGIKIGTATSTKIGFYNTTPVIQPTSAISDNVGSWTLNKVVAALRLQGIIGS